MMDLNEIILSFTCSRVGKERWVLSHIFTLCKKFMANKTTATLNKGITINKPVNKAAPAGFAKLSVHHILVIFLGTQVLV